MPKQFRVRNLVSAAVVAGISLAASSGARAESQPKTLGYAIAWFGLGLHRGADDCPQGMTPKTDATTKLKGLSKKEQAELQLPRNMGKMQELLIGRGPHKENACHHPEALAEPPLRTVQGKIAYGLDLDGGAPKDRQCQHEQFTSTDGAPGVDNQLYRTIGCMFGFREDGEGGYLEKVFNQLMIDGESSMLIEVRGVTDMKNDRVQVGFYKGATSMLKDASGNGLLSDATFLVVEDPHWHNVTTGTIVNGILTTEPVDMTLYRSKNDMAEYFFRDARLRLDLRNETKATGVFGAYQDWEPIYHHYTKLGFFAESSIGHTCPSLYAALNKFADGYRDPATGKCSAISLAYKVEAIPAFIVHPEQKTAAAPATNERK